jgi:uncharacterized protein YkwD
MRTNIRLLLTTIALSHFIVNGNSQSNRKLRVKIGDEGRGGSGGVAKNTGRTNVKRTWPPVATPTVSPSPTNAPSPTDISLSCNVCTVLGAKVSLGSSLVLFDAAELSCAELETNGQNGSISDADCGSAQGTAASSCGCMIPASLGVKDNPICSDVALSGNNLRWLEAHNSRREYWHAYYDVDFEPLCWDSTLASQSQFYANYLADNCLSGHDQSIDPNDNAKCRRAGENLSYDSWSIPNARTPLDITLGWADEEFNDSYPNDLRNQIHWLC